MPNLRLIKPTDKPPKTPSEIASEEWKQAGREFVNCAKAAVKQGDNAILVVMKDGRVDSVIALDPTNVCEVTGALEDAKFRYQVENYLEQADSEDE